MADLPAEPVPAQSAQPAAVALDLDIVRAAITEALSPAHYLVGPGLRLEWAASAQEEIFWQIFHGRLLDAAQTRARRSFETWNVFVTDANGRSAEPLLSVKLDAPAGQLHVVRAIHSYAWEAYDAGGNVIKSRETKKWLRELVGTVDLTTRSDPEAVRAAVVELLFQAVVGTSRLPLTSVEAPLPGFSLGTLAYFAHSETRAEPMRSALEFIERGPGNGRSEREEVKLLETVLRFTPAAELPAVAERFVAHWLALGRAPRDIVALLRTVFNEVALSPYTDFVDKTLGFLRLLEDRKHITAAEHADFLGFVLRHLARHLTAYDLVVYHHRGANYPDALLLDAALRTMLDVAERQPALFLAGADDSDQQRRLRRRALRMGLLLRRQYEGHEVPDAPTSPGENTRILPAPHARVPGEQVLDPTRRQRKLFADGSPPLHLTDLGRELLRQSVADLEHAAELRELGTALFLDRPLGIFKRPGAPDRTPLLSYEAFSPSIAERRLDMLTELAGQTLERQRCRLRQELQRIGLPLAPSGLAARPGVVSLDDALKVARDFVLLRTTRRTASDFFTRYHIPTLASRFALADLFSAPRVLIVGAVHVRAAHPGTLLVFDDHLRQRLELEIDARQGYTSSPTGEDPCGGLRLLRVWEATGDGSLQERDLRLQPGEPRSGHSPV